MSKFVAQPNGAGASQALALVMSSNKPVLLLDGDLNVVAASASFCQTYQVDASAVANSSLAHLGDGD